jgi:hypothetical protein
MTYRSWLPHGIGPTGEARAALDRARGRLADALDRHYWRLRRIELKQASQATVECVVRHKYLSRVLAGPRGDSDIIDRRSAPRRGDRQATNI